MSKDLTIEEAVGIISATFAPLRCVAEPWDHGKRIRFRVFDASDEPLLKADDLLKQQDTDPKRLEALIIKSRGRLSERGFSLAPWSIPDCS